MHHHCDRMGFTSPSAARLAERGDLRELLGRVGHNDRLTRMLHASGLKSRYPSFEGVEPLPRVAVVAIEHT
jgi:hypothetical protein